MCEHEACISKQALTEYINRHLDTYEENLKKPMGATWKAANKTRLAVFKTMRNDFKIAKQEATLTVTRYSCRTCYRVGTQKAIRCPRCRAEDVVLSGHEDRQWWKPITSKDALESALRISNKWKGIRFDKDGTGVKNEGPNGDCIDCHDVRFTFGVEDEFRCVCNGVVK